MSGLWCRDVQVTQEALFAWVLLGSWCFALHAQAGTLVTYIDDIRPRVFEPHCLQCHHSMLSGAERNGAPSSVNWDTYELAVQGENAARAVSRVVQGTMPPIGPLSAELKQLMIAWQDGGFAESIPGEECPHDGLVSQGERRLPTPLDALLALQHYLGTAIPPLNPCQQVRANVVNAENSPVTPIDAQCIFRRFLGVPSCLD